MVFYMAEFLEEVDGSRGMSRTEHALRSVLESDIETVRSRLIHALERLDYTVISDEPLHARRRARGLAPYLFSANILEYPIKLTIGLRQIGPHATLATFDYVAEHTGSVSFKGDLQTLTREAEAIIALASSQTTASACSSCGTKQNSEDRFCRICGAPTVRREAAELEVLRVTAGARAGHHLITVGAVWITVSTLAAFAFMIVNAGVPGLIGGLLFSQVLAGLVILFWGMRNLSGTLNPHASRQTLPAIDVSNELSGKDVASLPQAPLSVTEGTTNLLVQKPKGREEEAVHTKARDTSPMD